MKVRAFFIMFLMVLIITLPFIPKAESVDSNHQWNRLDQISDEVLQMVKRERYEEAKQLLQYFSNEFLKVSLKDRLYSMDELRIITITHNNALEATTSTSLSIEDRVRRATQFRLVIDAIGSENQPLWTGMENSIMTTFKQLKETIQDGDNQTFQYQFNLFLNKYDTIHPSLMVDLTPETIQKMNAHINFLDNYRNEVVSRSNRVQQIEEMEQDLNSIFNENKDEADPSVIWVMITTGSVIILTLSYVGWRKYKGDKEKRKSRLNSDE